jgi:drug/metabolite transporter (DMT)-like permease
MTLTVFAVVLFAAFLHASWNAIVKGAGDTLIMTMLIAGCAAVISALALPFVPQPAPQSWPALVASAVIHLAYYTFLIGAYRAGDMSRMYPIMRGTAPLLVAVISALFLNETITLAGWTGVVLVSLGILSLAVRGGGTAGVGFALANAVVIAGYTLVDGAGVRASGSPAGYTLWLLVLSGIPLIAWVLATRRAAFVTHLRTRLHLGVIGALGTLVSYGLALWAMTVAPVPIVAALRETSILWATAIAGLILRERIGPARIAAVGLIALGAIVLRLA